MLKRAIRTLWIVLDEMDLMWLPVEKHWRLNERHYGALQGLTRRRPRRSTAKRRSRSGGAATTFRRRRSTRRRSAPPARTTGATRRLPRDELPLTESLKDTLARVLPYWDERIAPEVLRAARARRRARQQPARAREDLDGITEEEIMELNIPDRRAAGYELDDGLKPVRSHYLGDPEAIAAAAAAVANQAKAKK